jgi:molybdopterin synthase sulfur carrier subunit
MAVEVRIPTILRKHTGGEKAVSADGDTVRDLIGDLERRHPGIAGSLLTGDGSLHRFVNVYVNDEDVRFLGALDAKLADGDVVAILPAVAGGGSGRRGPAGGVRGTPKGCPGRTGQISRGVPRSIKHYEDPPVNGGG